MRLSMDCHGKCVNTFPIKKATYFKINFDPSPQPNKNDDIVGSENCLWLNIFTPQMPDETTGLPVIVFIHGGGYRVGSANQYTVQSLDGLY